MTIKGRVSSDDYAIGQFSLINFSVALFQIKEKLSVIKNMERVQSKIGV